METGRAYITYCLCKLCWQLFITERMCVCVLEAAGCDPEVMSSVRAEKFRNMTLMKQQKEEEKRCLAAKCQPAVGDS